MKPDPNDTQFEDNVITKVKDSDDYYEVSCSREPDPPDPEEDKMAGKAEPVGGWSFSLAKEHGVVPKVGATMRTYGGFGYPIRGVVIDGACAFYRTADEQKAHQKEQNEAREREDRKKWEESKAEREAKVDALPPEFQKRVAWFRVATDHFWKQEGYEVFCCEQAVLIAKTLGTAEKVGVFNKLTPAEQRVEVPDLSDEHSGNTFGSSVTMAALYLDNPELVWKWHGALHALTGCDEYGCFAAYQETGEAFEETYAA